MSVRAGTVTSDYVTHFCQIDGTTFSVSEHAPMVDWVTLAYSDPDTGDTSVMVIPREAFGRAAATFLGVEQ